MQKTPLWRELQLLISPLDKEEFSITIRPGRWEANLPSFQRKKIYVNYFLIFFVFHGGFFMSEKIKIVLKPVEALSSNTTTNQLEKIKLKPKEIQPETKPTFQKLEDNLDHLDHDSYLKHFFIKPLRKLIKNEGVHDGALIAQVCALEIMEKMFDSLLHKDRTSVTDILYEAAFADYSIEEDVEDVEDVEEEEEEEEEVAEEEEVEEVSNKVEELHEEEIEEEDDEEEDEDEEEITDEYDYESDIEEARECESYMGEYEDESMDG
jgi:hypothetical protein